MKVEREPARDSEAVAIAAASEDVPDADVEGISLNAAEVAVGCVCAIVDNEGPS